MRQKTFIDGFKTGQRVFGEKIGAVVNTVLLSMVYLVGVGSTSIISKLFGKKFLEKNIDEKSPSYWHDLNIGKRPLEEYYRQF